MWKNVVLGPQEWQEMDMRQYFEPTDYAHLYREKNSGIYYARMDSRQGGRKTVRRSLKTKELTEAIAKMAAFLQEMGADTPATGNVSWYVAVDTYIARQKMRPNLKPLALQSILLFARHAKELVASDVPAISITPHMCRLWWAAKTKSNAPRTANGTLCAIRKIFSILIESGSVKEDPTTKLELMRVKPTDFFIPGKDDFARIVQEIRRAPVLRGHTGKKALESPAADMVEFLAYSGLRIEEARRLTWGDIGPNVVKVPAIKHAVKPRMLYINPALQGVIEGMKKLRGYYAATDSVFLLDNPRKALTNACTRLGLPHMRVHDLRHFFATTCIEQGVDIPTVAKWLGHQDGGALAMRVYGHLRDEHSKEQASKLKF